MKPERIPDEGWLLWDEQAQCWYSTKIEPRGRWRTKPAKVIPTWSTLCIYWAIATLIIGAAIIWMLP